MWVNS